MLVCSAHPVVDGWIDRVVGWIDNKLEELARYAADPTAGGGLQSVDYFVLQLLNRDIPVLKHFRSDRATSIRSGCMRSCCGSPASLRHSRRRSGARANIRSTITTISKMSSPR